MPKLLNSLKIQRAYHLFRCCGWTEEEVSEEIDASTSTLRRWRKLSVADPDRYMYSLCKNGRCWNDTPRPRE